MSPSDREKEPVIICSNSGCLSSRGKDVLNAFKEAIAANEDISKRYYVKKGSCHGFCEVGPTAIVGNKRIFYIKLNPEKALDIVRSHLADNEIVKKYLYYSREKKSHIAEYDQIPFIKHQKRYILKDNPFVDPESYDDYVAHGGFEALKKVLQNENPFEICDIIKESGLRGRGGGGYLTGNKWRLHAEQISQPKYVICNGDEGDPGTFMDRSLLEGDPYRILEGMMIAGYATMSTNGIVYLRKEYNLAVCRIKKAIAELYEKEVLGSSVMDQPFSFDIRVEFGPGAYISGEETALLSSIESKRGNPKVKPPYPVEKGLFEKPTLINNVETYANVREIILMGNEKYREIGIEPSVGTKIFTLSGSVKNSGLVEMPFGVTFNTLINDIGGGMLKKSKLKAMQLGGASGSIMPASLINEKITWANLKKIGGILGAGGLVVLDENTCVVDLTKYYIEFAQAESCGFCVPCREGSQKLLTILDRIVDGKGKPADIAKMKDLVLIMFESSRCGLGREAVNPLISMLDFFEDELMEHINDKKCRAGVCPRLVKFTIDRELCIGCGACQLNCPVDDAIEGIKGQYYSIDGELCIRCGTCYKICPNDAIIRS